METTATEPAVKISVDTQQSDSFHTLVTFEMDETRCDSYSYAATTRNAINAYLGADASRTVMDYLLEYGSIASESATFRYTHDPGLEIVFLALPLKDGLPVHDPVQVDYQIPEIKIDPALGAEVTVTSGETDVTVSVLANGNPTRIIYSVFDRGMYDQYASDPTVLYYETLQHGFAVEFTENPTVFTPNGLIPDNEYALCVVLLSDTGHTPALWSLFTTLKHEASAATITLDIREIRDYSATFDVTLQGGVSYKYGLMMGTEDEIDPQSTAAIISQNQMFTSPAITLDDLVPETTYTLCGIAYDADGVYGALSCRTFTTLAPIPGQDTEEYRRMIGCWRMRYDNFFGPTAVHPELIVDIREDVVGNTYRVSGLLTADSRIKFGIDDTVGARYIDGQIVLESGTPIADAGSLSDKYDVRLTMLNTNGQLWTNRVWKLKGTYANDGITFAGEGDPAGIIGYIIYAFAKTGNNTNSAIEQVAPMNITLEKCSAGSGTTEGFGYDTPWNPGWK